MSDLLSIVNGLKNSGGMNNVMSPDSMNYLKSFKMNDIIQQDANLQESETLSKISSGISNIDFSKVNNSNDSELKADIYGLVEKNQFSDENGTSESDEISTGKVADKFSDVLGNYIKDVNSKNREAEKAVETFVSGGNIDMHSVMIAAEKASLSMQLAVQMKNKILQAYQEVSRVQV